MVSQDDVAAPKLGIIAGGGSAPAALMDACLKFKREFYVICLEGQADEHVADRFPHAWVPLGSGLRLKAIIEEQKIGEIVMIGRVRRPSILELKPDRLSLKFLTKVGFSLFGDDTLLSSVGKAIEDETGARVVAAQTIFSGLLTPEGVLGKIAPDTVAEQDIARGLQIVKLLGQADVGQSVIVQQGLVLGLEAIEGTDALILRAGSLRREGPGGILVKMAKPQQDNRFDLPTIGRETVATLIKAGMRGIVIEAGRSLFLEREQALELADNAGIFVLGIKSHA